jgi:ATP:ADP antiporter, AAA family
VLIMSNPAVDGFEGPSEVRVAERLMAGRRRSPLARAIGLFPTEHPGEGKTALLLSANACLLMVCYYVLKTLREPLLLADGAAEHKSYAHAVIATVLLVIVPLYGTLYRRTDRRQLLRYVTLFFIANLLVFYALSRAGVDIGFAYYVWVGVFGVLMPAQLWAHAANIYKPESGQRLFPLIMVGAALGAIAGPKVASGLFATLGAGNLLVFAALMLAAALPLLDRTYPCGTLGADVPVPASVEPKRLLGGFSLVLRDRYLMLLAALAVLLNCVNSIGEYILSDFVKRDAAARTEAQPHLDAGELIIAFYGDFNFAVNALGLIFQLFLVARIVRWVGVQGALLVLPVIAFVGYGLIFFAPIFTVVYFIKVLENGTDYSVMNTARHSLYLPLSAAQKYEGKTTVDAFFWRLGDVVQAAIIYLGLHLLDLDLGQFALVNVVLAGAWLAIAVRLGNRYPVHPPRRIAVSRRVLILGATSAAFAVSAFTWPLESASAQPTLFASHEPINVMLEADLKSLCRRDGPKRCEDTPAAVTFRDSGGAEHRIDATLRVRGKWRADASHCAVPPLFVVVDDAADRATILGDHPTVLPLTTHCREKPSAYEQYVLKEYLAYRLYALLTDQSLRVQLARITYRNSARRGRNVERFALFVEHFDALAARLGGEIIDPDDVDLADADPRALTRLELFQYMIGNTDWSIAAGHNIVHLRAADGSIIPVPYDFDFSGLVNALYAGPPPQLPIRTVTQRLFRGYCRSDVSSEDLFDELADRQADAQRLVAETPGLDARHRNEVARFLEGFFQALASPKKRQRIVAQCREV